MNGILAVNHFLKGEKYDTLHKHLAASAKKCGINLNIKTNLELATQKAQADFVLFWDKDINLARRIEKAVFPFSILPNQLKNATIKAEHILNLTALCLSLKLLLPQNAISNQI